MDLNKQTGGGGRYVHPHSIPSKSVSYLSHARTGWLRHHDRNKVTLNVRARTHLINPRGERIRLRCYTCPGKSCLLSNGNAFCLIQALNSMDASNSLPTPNLNVSAVRSGLGLGEAFRVVDQHRTGEIRYKRTLGRGGDVNRCSGFSL